MHTVALRPRAEHRALRGHLWIFSNEIQKPSDSIPTGADVRVRNAKGRTVGTGTFNPGSLITIRLHILHREKPLDSDLIKRRFVAAYEMRKRWLGETGILSCRLVNAEGDLLPGLIVDRYGDTLSVQCLTAGMDQRIEMILDVLTDQLRPSGILLRNDAQSRTMEGLTQEISVARGHVPLMKRIQLGGLWFQVNLHQGQKTGFYFDQRENYGLVQPFCTGKRVLDAFCFTGAWAIHAAGWKADEVLAVDGSAAALDLARQAAEDNDLTNIRFQKADVLASLKDFASHGEFFDLIILDPPAYARSRKQEANAFKGHLNLQKWALRCLKPEGILVTCCCSSYLEPDRFLESIILASRQVGRRLRHLAVRGQSMDHPWIPAMPETAYLKVHLFQSIGEA